MIFFFYKVCLNVLLLKIFYRYRICVWIKEESKSKNIYIYYLGFYFIFRVVIIFYFICRKYIRRKEEIKDSERIQGYFYDGKYSDLEIVDFRGLL